MRQSLYFQQIFKILELWGFEQAKQAYHLGYEIVRLPEGMISSRKGNAPLYDDVRDAVLARAREIIDEKNPDLPAERKAEVAWHVALGSLKYAMLARDNNKVVVFDLDEALSFDGHAAPYIQYAHARACRILEHAGETDASLLARASMASTSATLQPEELSLLQPIAALPEEIQRAAEEYRPLLIASYVYDLAKRFNDFYHACPVLASPEPTRTARLALTRPPGARWRTAWRCWGSPRRRRCRGRAVGYRLSAIGYRLSVLKKGSRLEIWSVSRPGASHARSRQAAPPR